MNLRSSLNRLKQIGFWIWRGKYHILTFVAVIFTIFYIAIYTQTSRFFDAYPGKHRGLDLYLSNSGSFWLYLGWGVSYYKNNVSAFLTITGVLIILTQQILDAKRFADHRPNTIRSWIMSYPTGKPITMSYEGSVPITISMKGDVKASISENATLDQKVAFLLRQANYIQTAIGKVDDRIDDVAASLTNKSKEIKTDLDNFNVSLKTIIAGHIVGAYDINLLGITITLCGTVIQPICS